MKSTHVLRFHPIRQQRDTNPVSKQVLQYTRRQIPKKTHVLQSKGLSLSMRTTNDPRSVLGGTDCKSSRQCWVLRWVPTGKIFTYSTTNVDSEPQNGSNADISNQYESAQTLDVSAGTSNLSAGIKHGNITTHSNGTFKSKLVPKVVPPADKTATSRQELELLFHHHLTMLRSTFHKLLTRVLRIILVIMPEHPSDTYVLTMKMEILLEPASNKLLVEEEMIKLRDLGANTPIEVPYTEEQILAMVINGMQQGHITCRGRQVAGWGTLIFFSQPRGTYSQLEIDDILAERDQSEVGSGNRAGGGSGNDEGRDDDEGDDAADGD
ncbi:hypothetical protein Tco_0211987 [Tanacetum coccineum]